MSWSNRIVQFFDGLFGSSVADQPFARMPMVQIGNVDESTIQDTYRLLRSLYYNNGAYMDMAKALAKLGYTAPTMKGLRTMQHAIVEFYVATIWPGALPDALPLEFRDENQNADAIRAAIHQVWDWSNWEARKQLYVRHIAMLGDGFIYVASRPDTNGNADRVYFHVVEPEYVTEIDVDTRGFLTYIRLDIPVYDREAQENTIRTEIWWKEKDSYRQYVTNAVDFGFNRKLGTLVADDVMTEDYGIDFVPFTHARFRDVGSDRGMAPIIPAIEKMHELNAKASRFSQQLYRHNKPDIAMVGLGGQTAGQYSPPPPIRTDEAGTVELGDEQVWTVPPGYDIRQLIANVNYSAHLAGIEADAKHLRESDLPELAYYLAVEGANMSGKAIRLMLTPAIAKVIEARGNAEASLIRADQMALTIGQRAGLPGFSQDDIGRYEDGSFDHWIPERDVVPPTADERMDITKTQAEIMASAESAGASLRGAAKLAGIDDETVDAMMQVPIFGDVEQ